MCFILRKKHTLGKYEPSYSFTFLQKYCRAPMCKNLDKCATLLVIVGLKPTSDLGCWWSENTAKPLRWETTLVRGWGFQELQGGLWDL